MARTDRRFLTMRAISALEEVMTAEASMHYELADAVIEALLETSDIYDKEDDEQAPEVRPASDEHDAEGSQAAGQDDCRAGGVPAAPGFGGGALHKCPFCTGSYSLLERLGVHIACTHFRSELPLPGQVGVPLPSRPKPRCSRCGETVESVEELATHLAYYHAGTGEPPC